ncbi:MAG: iron-containing alcohol dehydrogenase, partial [Solirubrobacteraceae bacterium]
GCVAASLGAELRALRVPTVAVIADRGFADAGLLESLLGAAPDPRLAVCALISEDPDLAEAERAAAAALELGAGAVLAVGGGSALCAAKAAAIRLSNPPPLTAYAGSDRLDRPPVPVIAVPTTAGSGSEVSNVVVLHEPGRARHLVIRGRGYEPRVALLDGDLLASLPPGPLIAAALDALSHALEALWVATASSFTDALAQAAAATIADALPRALEGDRDEAQALIEASASANLACGNAGLGLVHALSSAASVRLPHGRQNGVLLPHVAAFNGPMLRPAVARTVELLGGLYEPIGFGARFADGELDAGDADAMVAAALANPFRELNCRPAGEPELRAILRAAGA